MTETCPTCGSIHAVICLDTTRGVFTTVSGRAARLLNRMLTANRGGYAHATSLRIGLAVGFVRIPFTCLPSTCSLRGEEQVYLLCNSDGTRTPAEEPARNRKGGGGSVAKISAMARAMGTAWRVDQGHEGRGGSLPIGATASHRAVWSGEKSHLV